MHVLCSRSGYSRHRRKFEQQTECNPAGCREGRIEPPAKKPIAKITLGALIFLTVGSVVYHTIFTRIFGFPLGFNLVGRVSQ